MTAPELWKEFYDANFYKHFAGHSFAREDFGRECFEAGILAGQSRVTPDTIPLPRAEVEMLYAAMLAAGLQAGEDQWSEPWFFNVTLALTVLKERMK